MGKKRHILLLEVIAIIVAMVSLPAITLLVGPTYTHNGQVRIVKAVIGSAVHITNVTRGWQGSGALITKDIVVTARHVVQDGDNFTVTLNNGRMVTASRAMSSKKYDVGFLLLDEPIHEDLPMIVLGSITECALGQPVFAIGSPFGRVNRNSVTMGIISRMNCNLSKESEGEISEEYGWPEITFQTDTNGEPGNSGCPVFSLDGVMRGIMVGGYSNGVVYCVPSDVFMGDFQTVKLMFLTDQYKMEAVPIPPVLVYPSEKDDPNAIP